MYITVQELKNQTTLDEIKELTDIVVEAYMDRADNWIRRETGQSWDNVEDEYIKKDLATATILLTEMIFWNDQELNKIEDLDNVESEKIGSYSYTVKDSSDEGNNAIRNKELKSILESLRYRSSKTGGSVFRVFGQSPWRRS